MMEVISQSYFHKERASPVLAAEASARQYSPASRTVSVAWPAVITWLQPMSKVSLHGGTFL